MIELPPNIATFIFQHYFTFGFHQFRTVFIDFFPTGIQLHYHSICHRYALGMIIWPQQLMTALLEKGMLKYLLIIGKGK